MSRDDLDARADAFVLGLLDERTEAELDAALSGDRAWAAAVGRARDRLLPLDMTAAELPGAAGLWDAIAPKLERAEPSARAEPLAAPLPANDPRPPVRWAPAGIAAAIGILAGAVLGGSWFVPDPVVIAVLVDGAGTPTAVIEDFGASDARIRFVGSIAVPEGRQMQVWTLPSAETGPVSLGLLMDATGADLDPPRLPPPADGQLYEITLEPVGGSPTGRPTGAILAKGLAARQDGI
ncbi:anti-sigma factor [Paracoccus sp. YIM 132242]|uniref:Anti-sigma factor n=1 Tax=Paracoccus lichenicola TaxID=2665644 RepID=A0A6L6HSQ5_9RHOB|nr:anti-sigma factor [Paracoccus lichenicola]MTE01449.1 anti-sigma factor [Paracoccus lichenicola]